MYKVLYKVMYDKDFLYGNVNIRGKNCINSIFYYIKSVHSFKNLTKQIILFGN